jgi:hypothetical protein
MSAAFQVPSAFAKRGFANCTLRAHLCRNIQEALAIEVAFLSVFTF